jgi:hypothetical protein
VNDDEESIDQFTLITAKLTSHHEKNAVIENVWVSGIAESKDKKELAAATRKKKTYGNLEMTKACAQSPVLPLPTLDSGSMQKFSRQVKVVQLCMRAGKVLENPQAEKAARLKFHTANGVRQFHAGRFSK